MKLMSYVLLAAVSVSAVSANAWHGRRGGPVVAGPAYHPYHRPPIFRPPMHHPPVYRPPIYRPPIYRPPIGPVYPPPILPPPIVEPVPLPVPVPVDPIYPIPNPIPDPIEQGYYGIPAQVFVRQPCDPRQYRIPVINTIPSRSVYCSSAYINACSQMFSGYQVHPYDVRAPGICEVRPTINRTFVLIVDGSHILAERTSEQNIAIVYRNSVRMGFCR